jgi:hypothetical protein
MSAVKEGQQKYYETVYSRSGINHMWILKNSKDLLDNLKSRSFSQVSSIKTFDCSTIYTTLPHDKLKTRLKETIHKGPVACFSDGDDVSGNQNNCYWPMHSESIARCKHHMQEKLVYCCTYLEHL